MNLPDISICMAVQRGVQLLDDLIPSWWMDLEPSEIEMCNTGRCLLGQLFGDYHAGLEELGFTPDSTLPPMYGFDAAAGPAQVARVRYQNLKLQWGAVILQRQREAYHAF